MSNTSHFNHVHCRPENLLYGDHTDDATLKLADFGLAKLLDSETMLHAQCGTPGYVAPEIVKNDAYGTQVDMWSLGVIAYILLCGFPPFYDDNNQNLFKRINSGKNEYPRPFWDEVSDKAQDFIEKLLILDPDALNTADEVLKHPFLTSGTPSTRRLSHFNQCMRNYNARRKFRAGIMSLQAISAMKAFSKTPSAGGASNKLLGALAAKKESEAKPAAEEEAGAPPAAPLVVEGTAATPGEAETA